MTGGDWLFISLPFSTYRVREGTARLDHGMVKTCRLGSAWYLCGMHESTYDGQMLVSVLSVGKSEAGFDERDDLKTCG